MFRDKGRREMGADAAAEDRFGDPAVGSAVRVALVERLL